MAPLRRLVRAGIAIVAVTTLALGVSSCRGVGGEVVPNGISVTIGSLSGFDNQVVAQIYGQALAARGYTVDFNTGIGSRKNYLANMQSGAIDLVPEYAGLLLESISPGADDTSLDTIMTALPIGLEPLGLGVLEPSTAQKSRVFVVTPEFAKAHSVVTVGDLAPVSSAITIGSADDLETASYGRSALEFSYGLAGWVFRGAADQSTVVQNLLDNSIQVADLSITDPAIEKNGLVVLKDPSHVITAQNLVPVLTAKANTPDLASTVDAVTRALSTDDLAEFSDSEDELASAVALDWLVEHGLIVVDD